MLKVLLISVGVDNKYGKASFEANKKRLITPMLSIPYIAAVLEEFEDVEVTVIDEAHGLIEELPSTDIVGLSGMTMHANRMYRLADDFRKTGAIVVLGGIHVSFMKEEAMEHGDVIVIGESELIWPEIIKDYKSNSLKKVYKTKEKVDIRKLPHPKVELMEGEAYTKPYGTMNAIMATRGCPNNCSFCCVKNMFGKPMRLRKIEDVCNEISKMSDDLILFADDNLIGNTLYARELFKEMKSLNKVWGGQVSITIGENEELLKAAADSGCKSLFIGIESINPKNIKSINKKHINQVSRYSELIKRIQSYGIEIFGSFIVGLDDDNERVFGDIYDFVLKNKIKYPLVGILTPFPGTKLFNMLKEQDRIIDYNWDRYNLTQVVFKPKKMTPDELQFNYDNLLYYLNKLSG